MGKKAKTSRKGKKAWRANISTEDVEDYVEQSNKEAVTGGSLADAPSDSLFYVDKSRDLSLKRKIEKHREKVLHCDSMLQRNPFVQPIAPSIRKKSKKKSKEIATAKASVQGSQKDQAAPESGLADIWNDNDGTNVKGRRKRTKTSVIPAVEVEPPGCSFNPDKESHQDSLACAVADEMQKVYRQELGPEPIPLTVPGEEVNEEEKYFLDADDGTDDEDANMDLVENADASQEKRDLKTKRVTRVEFNRRTRRKERLKIESESEKLKKLSAEIDGLPDIMQEIAKEDEEKEKRHLRRTVAKHERLKSFPPRLGKRKFEPAPMQVQLSDEITGSIRKLKGCCTLARDRYKSLEKRGLIIPTKKSGRFV